jgi:hypothetical protein
VTEDCRLGKCGGLCAALAAADDDDGIAGDATGSDPVVTVLSAAFISSPKSRLAGGIERRQRSS